MKHKLLLIYTWFIRVCLYFLPDIPLVMRFRGWLYSFGMKSSGKNFQVAHNVILNSLEWLSVGDNVYFAMGNISLCFGGIKVENNVMFGPNCVLTAGNHTYLNGSYRFGPSKSSPIIIGCGSWIGANCTILPGVNFPKSSVAAAGSVITKTMKYNGIGIYGGIPAKFIKSNI